MGYAQGNYMLSILANPWAWIVLVAVLGVSNATTAWYSFHAGQDKCEAATARDERVAQIASAAAAASAAEAISRIEVKNTTIRQTLEKEVRERTIYTDCRSGDLARRLLNDTAGATSPAQAASGSKLPASGAAQ